LTGTITGGSSVFRWQAEGENGALPHAAHNAHGSPVRLDNRLRYRQAHAGTWDSMPLIFPSIKLFEDVVNYFFFDPRPLVRNTEGIEFVAFSCRDPDGLIRGGIELRVSHEVSQYSLCQR
jgi:hypothetical protein